AVPRLIPPDERPPDERPLDERPPDEPPADTQPTASRTRRLDLAGLLVAGRGGDPLLNLDGLRAPGLPPGLAALVATQLAYGGLLFAFTLYLQAGLGDSALRAGLTYVPMAATFGLVGY